MSAGVREAILNSLRTDVTKFASLLTVLPKETKTPTPFILNGLQKKLVEAVEAGHKRILVVKPRQIGYTTVCKLIVQHRAYFSQAASKHAIISLRDDSAASLLADNARWVKDLAPLGRSAKVTRAKITWDHNGSSISTYSARSHGGIRGQDPATVLISEAAYAQDLSKLLAEVEGSIGFNDLLILESTIVSPGDTFAKLVRDPGEYHLISVWWHEHSAYALPDSECQEFVPSDEERTLMARDRLTVNQMAWRRKKIGALAGDVDLFRKEFPGCMEDLFLRSSGTHFPAELLAPIKQTPRTPSLIGQAGTEWWHPAHKGVKGQREGSFAMGVDPAAGEGGDYSAVWVVDQMRTPVYSWRSNRTSMTGLAEAIVQIGAMFNQPLTLVEENNHGHAVLLALQNFGYWNLWGSRGKQWSTTAKSKLELAALLRDALHSGLISELYSETWLEVRSLRTKDGLAPSHPVGGHDDLAWSLALALRAIKDVAGTGYPSLPASPRERWEHHQMQSRLNRNRI